MGYWKKETLLRELGPHDPDHPSETRVAQSSRLRVSHEWARDHRGRPVAELLRQIEEETYTKGNVG